MFLLRDYHIPILLHLLSDMDLLVVAQNMVLSQICLTGHLQVYMYIYFFLNICLVV